MSGVYFSSRTNSTMFTTCCHAAITDSEANCPVCRQEVSPRSHQGRWQMAYGAQKRGIEAMRLALAKQEDRTDPLSSEREG